MAQLNNSTLELHQRVLADLDRRDLAIGDKESEARRLFEQVLAQCSAERNAIAGERKVLMQAEELYVRFLATRETKSSDEPPEALALVDSEKPNAADPASEPEAPPPTELLTEPPVELLINQQTPEISDRASDIEAKMRELRNGLADEVAKENAAEQKPTKWPSPLRALLGTSS